MSTSKAYCDHILEQLNLLDDITVRPMMGEYLLYFRGVLVGGIYDERLLIKESPSTEKYQMMRVIPYESAKRTMYYFEDVDNKEKFAEVIQAAYADLSKTAKKPRARKK